MKRVVLMVLVIAVFVGSSYTPHARADTSDELLSFVRDAYANLMALDSFTSTSDQTYDATLKFGGNPILVFNYMAAITSRVIPNQGDITAHTVFNITMTTDAEPAPMYVVMEMFMDGETIYARISDTGATEGGDSLVAAGWVNTDLLADQASPAYNGMNEAAFLELYGMNYPLVPGVPGSVTELPAEEIDGQEMRFIQLAYTTQTLDAAGVLDSMVDVFNGWAMGDDTADLTRQMLDGAFYDLTVWIGVDDHLPHQFADHIAIESTLKSGDFTMDISAVMTLVTTLGGINEPLTLTPPEVD